MPTNAAMEQTLGIRFTRVAVVGDGGLVEAAYVVLDPEKASRFQADTAHPPTLQSEARNASTKRVSLMRQGHQMRAGQTYYFVYRNGGVVEAGETASLVYGNLSLTHIPVL